MEEHLTSSLGHPKIFVKEFFNGFVPFHDHCSGEKLAVEWQTDLYGRHCLSHSQYLVNAKFDAVEFENPSSSL